MRQPFGTELLVDIYGCPAKVCDDLHTCYQFLEQIVKVLKVAPQSPPFIFRTDATRFPDKAGLSGWIPLVESGVQIHTLTVYQFISLDIYSCKPFSPHRVLDYLAAHFPHTRIEHQLITRGRLYASRNLRTPRPLRHRP